MKLMRSTKEGSKCADCGTEVKIGDPIAYYGKTMVFGLSCHSNEKTKKLLAELEELEALEALKNKVKLPAGVPGKYTPEQEVVGNKVFVGQQGQGLGLPPSHQQEWVVRIEWETEHVENHLNAMRWLLKARYCGQLGGHLNVLEFRAPRSVATAMTKTWAESLAKELCPFGKVEVAPLWL